MAQIKIHNINLCFLKFYLLMSILTSHHKHLVVRIALMKAALKLLFSTAAAALMSGCATLLSEDVQELKVKLLCKNKPVPVSCTARNALGSWRFITPGHVEVKTDASMLEISCKGQSVPEFKVSVPPLPSWQMAGNILVGGILGAALDTYSGSGLRYPENIDISNPACE
jgi:hypothetical protein